MKNFFYIFVIFIFGCSYIFENDSFEITDKNNDGYDDRDYQFLKKLIENSQGFAIPPDSTLNPLEIGDQIWVEGRLRSLKHKGGAGGFYLYGEIPSEIKDVEFLNKIHFEDNQFTSIPEEIGELKHLSEIILNDNRFSGVVPEALWLNKSSLKNLSIYNNNFTSIDSTICDYYDGITNFVISHNNLCDIPDCIQNIGIQSCNCYDYITMDICLEPADNLLCDENETLGDIINNCPLLQFWGDSLYNELININLDACLNWTGDCNQIYEINELDVGFPLEIEDECVDCNGNSCDGKLPWVGDGTCDESDELSFSCPEFNCDMEDCGFYSEAVDGCYCQRDCFGACIKNSDCGDEYWAAYGYDCCVDDGTCTDVSGDGVITSWLGDGWCDDGSWGYGFNCQEVDGFEFNCDNGDCGFWNDETGQCEPAPGQIIRYHDDYKYKQNFEEK